MVVGLKLRLKGCMYTWAAIEHSKKDAHWCSTWVRAYVRVCMLCGTLYFWKHLMLNLLFYVSLTALPAWRHALETVQSRAEREARILQFLEERNIFKSQLKKQAAQIQSASTCCYKQVNMWEGLWGLWVCTWEGAKTIAYESLRGGLCVDSYGCAVTSVSRPE